MSEKSSNLEAEQLIRMVEISRVLNSATDLDQLLSQIIKEAADLTRTEAASILLLDPRTRQLHFIASSNEIPPQMANMPVSLENSIAGAIFTENQPMLIPDVSKDKRWNKEVDKAINFQTRSILGVPMHNVDQQPVGVLEAINKPDGSKFTIQDVQMLAVLADIAGVAVEKARLFDNLQRANAELNELDQLKTDFIAIASHELRTPLSVILGYVSFLREEATPEMMVQFDSVLEAAVHLRGLIQDMLNLRYVDAGEATLNREQVELSQLLRDMAVDTDETALAKSQTISLNIVEEPLPILVDKEMLELIMSNLIGNAIKFTPQGGVIDIRLERQGGEAWITVSDNGVGVPPDQLERIFKRFYQVESPLVRQHEGMGLGLSIARELVELHQGRIWAENRAQGSQFTLAFELLPE